MTDSQIFWLEGWKGNAPSRQTSQQQLQSKPKKRGWIHGDPLVEIEK